MGNKASKREKGLVGDAPPIGTLKAHSKSVKAVPKKVEVPRDSPLGRLLSEWEKYAFPNITREKMTDLCVHIWPTLDLGDYDVPGRWPPFGTCDRGMVRALDLWYQDREGSVPTPLDWQRPYVAVWVNFADGCGQNRRNLVKCAALRAKNPSAPGLQDKSWDPLDHLPPPYVPQGAGGGEGNEENDEGAVGGEDAPPLLLPPRPRVGDREVDEVLQFHDKYGAKKEGGEPSVQAPLRQVPQGGGEIGYVEVPLTSAELRAVKQQLPKLQEDPEGFVKELEGLLGTSTYTMTELKHIVQQVTSHEVFIQAVDQARIAYTRRTPNTTPVIAAEKIPYDQPGDLDMQKSEDREKCVQYRSLILEGLKLCVPKVVNLNKAFGHPQRKEENADEFLERLKKGMRQYAGMDPDAAGNEAVLKLQFLSGAYPDIQKKLQKMEGILDKPLTDLVKEAQKVMIRREMEKEKRKVQLMVQTVRAVTGAQEGAQQKPYGGRGRGKGRNAMGPVGSQGRSREPLPRDVCGFCRKKGHWKRECPQRGEQKLQDVYLQALQYEDSE